MLVLLASVRYQIPFRAIGAERGETHTKEMSE